MGLLTLKVSVKHCVNGVKEIVAALTVMSPEFFLRLVTDVVEVLGPEMMKESKSNLN